MRTLTLSTTVVALLAAGPLAAQTAENFPSKWSAAIRWPVSNPKHCWLCGHV